MTNPCENCQIRHKQNVEWFKNYQDYSTIYNNTVISLGYASLLFIYSTVETSIQSIAFKQIFGFLFLVSAALFVVSELHESYLRSQINSILNIVNNSENPNFVLDAWFIEYNKLHGSKVYKFIQKYIYFWLSAITGVLAGLMLITWCFYPEIFKMLKVFLALFFI